MADSASTEEQRSNLAISGELTRAVLYNNTTDAANALISANKSFIPTGEFRSTHQTQSLKDFFCATDPPTNAQDMLAYSQLSQLLTTRVGKRQHNSVYRTCVEDPYLDETTWEEAPKTESLLPEARSPGQRLGRQAATRDSNPIPIRFMTLVMHTTIITFDRGQDTDSHIHITETPFTPLIMARQ